jgi:hypothetical protein
MDTYNSRLAVLGTEDGLQTENIKAIAMMLIKEVSVRDLASIVSETSIIWS